MNQLDLFGNRKGDKYIFEGLDENIVKSFNEFHRDNPSIFQLFRRFSYELWHSGRRQYGAKAIIERIRWHMEVERKEDFKLNNNYTSCYARLMILEDSRFKKFFETRKKCSEAAA